MRKSIKKLLLIIMISFCLVGCGIGNDAYQVNETAKVLSEDIKMTILGSEDVMVSDATFDSQNGEYTKVKIKVENIGTKEYIWSVIKLKLGDKSASLYSGPDSLEERIPAGESRTGYVYFDKTDATVLQYRPLKIDTERKGNSLLEVYKFKIK